MNTPKIRKQEVDLRIPGSPKKFKTGKQLYDVQIEPMNPTKVANLKKLLKNKYKADPEDIKDLFRNLYNSKK